MSVKACATITLYRVDDGKPGAAGVDGKTQYLHIKYSDDGETFTSNNGEDLGAWIGILVNFDQGDSNVFSDYTWKKFTEDVDEDLEHIRQTIVDQRTEILETAEAITMSALSNYVESYEHNDFMQSVESQLRVLADNITMNFNKSTEQVTETNDYIQRIVETLEKHFEFSVTGLTIKAGDNDVKLVLDNGIAYFELNGQKKTTVDPNSIKTGNIFVAVNEIAQFGNYGFVPYEDSETDGLDLVRVGG